MERILAGGPDNVPLNIPGELRVHLVEYILPVIERPHLPNRFITYTYYNASDVLHQRVQGYILFIPVLTYARGLVIDGIEFFGFCILITQLSLILSFMSHIVHPGTYINYRLESRMGGHVVDALSVNPDFASVPDRFTVFVSCA